MRKRRAVVDLPAEYLRGEVGVVWKLRDRPPELPQKPPQMRLGIGGRRHALARLLDDPPFEARFAVVLHGKVACLHVAPVGQRADIKRTQVGFETLRWTCALRDYRTGMSEEQLRQKMGLSKISWRETREKIFQLANR